MAAEDEALPIAYIAVGSNIRPEDHIEAAFGMLARVLRILGVSTFYITPPADGSDQPHYVNGMIAAGSAFSVRSLKFDVLRPTEERLGRVRSEDKYAPRTIDLDIVLYDDLVVREPDLVTPDPDIRTRDFIALPLYELAPDVVLPDTGEALSQIVRQFDPAAMQPHPLTQHLRELAATKGSSI
jgi:dihydroneopterin aldolase/2-amino-4-hydroxy-6-hydroxymethyldihydropteridine diphosphokinase